MPRLGRSQPIKPHLGKLAQVVSIQFQAASNSGDQVGQSTYSWSHSWTGDSRFIAVDVSMLSAGQTVTGITYNGQALSLIVARSTVTSFGRIECWGASASALGGLSPGTYTIAVTLSGAINSVSTAVSYSNVHQSAPTEAADSNQATNVGAADATVNITTVADQDWIHAAIATTDTSITASQTSRNNVAGTGGAGADEDFGPQAAGAKTMGWTDVGALATWAVAGYGVRPVTASGGNTTVTPSTLALILAAFAPVVATPRLCTPSTKSLTLTTFAPTVLTPRLCTPSTKALTLTIFAPVVSTPRLCTPSTKALILATFAPVVATPRLCTPNTKSLTLATFAPAVATPRLCTPSTLALLLTPLAPTVSTPRLCTPSTLALVTAKFAPSINIGIVSVPTTRSLTTTGFSPSISAPRLCTPSTLALVATKFAPVITVAPVSTAPSATIYDTVNLGYAQADNVDFPVTKDAISFRRTETEDIDF